MRERIFCSLASRRETGGGDPGGPGGARYCIGECERYSIRNKQSFQITQGIVPVETLLVLRSSRKLGGYQGDW